MYENNLTEAEASPLVLLPGLMCDARIFASQIDGIAMAQAAPDYGDCDSLDAMAGRVLAMPQERFALLGHSMGARVALEVVRRAPERVTRLALVSTGVHPVVDGEAAARHALRDLGRAEGIDALIDAWLPPMVAPSRRTDAALLDPLRAMCRDAGIARYEAQIAALLARRDVAALLPTITYPVLVAVGSEDGWSTPAQHAAIAATLPDAELIVVPGAGHMLPVEDPAALNAAIAAWLTRPTRYPYPQ